ncbi:hypothetical protein OJF2_37320 [Aquisphaera giovannonii]|uniref:DUF1304 domain-containing protein n=1 Tax=Aquisphaera giovannonii TaxID=406548 RepID=A0A5B9W4V6_9BACT|nr:DUF1304 family protein [Aquisphaera giovannonii]QEH35185.1 hypothetical protein OJF2_37320 [Aquisphaera giovannonii]
MSPELLPWLPVAALALLAIVHAAFAYKEIFDWEAAAVEVLGMPPEVARACAAVGRNQGLSNAALAAGAAWALVVFRLQDPAWGRQLATFFGAWALVAGVFGYATFHRPGFLVKQALPGLLALLGAWLPALLARGVE